MERQLHYEKHGSGKEILILFHGFGQNNKNLITWISSVNSFYTIYNFDLIFHGKSLYPNKSIYPKEWKEHFEVFLQQEGINHFSIAAFSLGGRFALTTYDLFSKRIDQIILVAPDGIYKSIWFQIATSTLGNPLFKYLMLHPSKFNGLLKIVENLGLATSQIVRFAQKELSQKENRKRVYRSWTYFKPLQPNLSSIAKKVNALKTPFHVVLGSRDHIIPVAEIKSKTKKITSIQYHILPLKHHQLIDGAKTLIPSLLKGDNL